MSWQKWVLVAFYVANVFLTVALIGKRREPITPGVAATVIALYGGLVALVVTA